MYIVIVGQVNWSVVLPHGAWMSRGLTVNAHLLWSEYDTEKVADGFFANFQKWVRILIQNLTHLFSISVYVYLTTKI